MYSKVHIGRLIVNTKNLSNPQLTWRPACMKFFLEIGFINKKNLAGAAQAQSII
jgi:hypothetical protein